MKPPKLLAVLSAVCFFGTCIAGLSIAGENTPEGSATPRFKEIWGYLLRGREHELTGVEPITHLCYFGVNLNRAGRITETVARPAVAMKNGRTPQIILVIAELSNASLMHFALDSRYGVRPLLIDDISRISAGFDGVQIDFESVSRDDAESFFDFLKELKSRLPAGKSLSIAVPARTRLIADAYDYTRLAPIVDRMIVMAYDEHWSTSAAGPVASLPWCDRVAEHVRTVVEGDKLVMGLPLYGRAWQDKRLARALGFHNVQDLIAEKDSTPGYTSELGAYFEYSENVVVKVFFDDTRALLEKLRLYRARDISSVSFWRIGLGPPELWSSIDAVSSIAVDLNGEIAMPSAEESSTAMYSD